MLPIGTRIADRYTLESPLGAGGMGEVYVAFDTRLERRVALKVLVPQASYSQQTLADWTVRMMREARAAAAFTHPNVVGIHDVGVHDGQPFLALELVKGASLRTYIGKDVALGRKVRWLVDVALGLAAAHRAGVIHRDVKPDNVLVSDEGPAKVLDFGIARKVDPNQPPIDPSAPTEAGAAPVVTAPGTLLGTPSYMAPEQLHGEQIDGRTDQFAWGVLAYELLVGSLPWRANDTIGTIAAILTRAPLAMPESLPPQLRDVVLRALSRDKEERFTSMERVAEVLRRFAERTEGDQADSFVDDETVDGPSESGAAPTLPRGAAPDSAGRPIVSSTAPGSGEETAPSTDVDPVPVKTEGTPPPFATTLQSEQEATRAASGAGRGGRRGVRLAAGAIAVLTLCAAGTAWFVRHRSGAGAIVYCAEWKERFGLPICALPVSAEAQARRSETLRFVHEKGRLVRIDSVNGRGTLMEDSGDRDVASRALEYNPDGSLASIVATDVLGRFRRKILVSEGGKRLEIVDLAGRPLGLRGTSITRIDRLLDAAGLVTQETFHTRGGAPRADADGAFGHLFTYDAAGRVVRTTHLGADQQPMVVTGGFVSERCIPDPLGGCSELVRLDLAEKPAHEKGVHRVVRKLDGVGNLVALETFDVTGRPAPPVGEAAYRTTFAYDDKGNQVDVRYRGRDDQPVRIGRGFAAGFHFSYDAHGRRIEERHLDPDGNLMRSAWGASIFRYVFDDATGALLEEAGFDASEAPTVYTFGCAKRSISQKLSPRTWSVRCFDTKGAPSRDTSGVHWNKYEADPSGKVLEWSSVDEKGALVANRELEARVRFKHDANGREIERAVFGADDKSAHNGEGYAKRKQAFDADGNLIEIRYLDSTGAPTFLREGYAIVKMTYDSRGLCTEERWLDPNGNGVVRSGGFSGERYTYDRHGRNLTTTALAANGQPVRRAGGYVTVQNQRDEAGRIVAISYLDEKGNVVRGAGKYAVERIGYDQRGLAVTRSFEDENHAPVARDGGYATKATSYDERGNPLEYRWLGVDGKAVVGPEGAASVKLSYDDADRVVSIAYTDPAGQPVLAGEGFAYQESRYDEDGNEVETAYLDTQRRPVAPTGKPFATIRRTFDGRRNNLETSTFDVRGGPIADEGGVATTRLVYDELGRVVKRATFDARGLPAPGEDGAAVLTRVYDDLGNVLERTYRDGAEQPHLGPEGYATRKARYDARGRTTEEAFFDGAGAPVLTKSGVAKRRFVFDLRGNLVETVALGLRDEPIEGVDGVNTERRLYDERGRLAELQRFDLEGKPTVSAQDHCHRVVVAYEPGPAESGRTCFDVAGKPVPGARR
jgi:serine/threonine protein kinase